MSHAFFAPSALLPGGWATDVRLEVDAQGLLTAIETDAAPGDALRLPGPVVPGMPDLHSHAFQRALVGRTQVAGPGEDSFWTWRQAMYASLDRLGPVEVAAVAGWLAVLIWLPLIMAERQTLARLSCSCSPPLRRRLPTPISSLSQKMTPLQGMSKRMIRFSPKATV